MDIGFEPRLLVHKRWYRKTWVIILAVIILAWMAFGFYLQYAEEKRVHSADGISLIPGTKSTKSGTKKIYDVVTTDDPSLGSPIAPVVIVQFGDFQCPYTRQENPVLKQVLKKYPEAVRLIYRDFPIPELHPHGAEAALAANCAGVQGKFWEYHDALFDRQSELGDDLYRELARTLGLNSTLFAACLAQDNMKIEIQQDLQAGLDAGLRGTPTFFVNGHKVEGAVPLELWDEIILEALKEKFDR